MKSCNSPPAIGSIEGVTDMIDETVIIEVKVNGFVHRVMLDSGAAVSVVSLGTLKQLKLLDKVKHEGHQLKSFNNASVTAAGYTTLQIVVGRTPICQKFSVINDENGNSSMILGRDFQRQFGSTTFDWQNGVVHLGKE